ncbi:MAG TPA: DEAD/DEAH box helicase [Patescibacteria group bacterium]|nr:DEAD/DEAH box helicase [Patescibacteria group bacterium]
MSKGLTLSFNQFDLDPRLQAGITRAGYTTATPIQTAAIPVILAGQDLIGTAQTGTGKTAAFVLPILHKLLAGPRGHTRALIITPTRELAEQIHETIRAFGADTPIRSATIYGGVGAGPQTRALREGVEILVVCPGRLLDHIEQRHGNFSKLDVLVLDEADRMFDMGFLPSIRKILSHLPARRQTLLFSATFPPEIEQLSASSLRNPQRIAVGISRPAHTVTHALFPVAQHLKTPLLLALLAQTDTESVLIFARTKHRAQRLAQQVARAGYKVTSLHGDRTQGQRQSALDGFREGTYQIMVATDIAARGLDVESVSHVINFDMPDTADAYIHRIGRTGRAERTGDAFTLVVPDDGEMVRALEKVMGQRLPRETLPGFDYAAASAPPRHLSATVGRSHRAYRKPARQQRRVPGRRAASGGR